MLLTKLAAASLDGSSWAGGNPGEVRQTWTCQTHKRRTDRQEDVRIPGKLTYKSAGSSLAPLQGWHTVVVAWKMWAVCDEEAPLYPTLNLTQMWQRFLLAGILWLSLALCALLLKAFFHDRRLQQVVPSQEREEVVRKSAFGQQAW
ncbi:hypothetical protein JZ751_002119 [Albula glossodonta]|uniref:Uncharacterized protein n=1 Tax=Albula glossodonta TaxID=121402 RepID=A0A8T2P753_9TELE|nr:hypothetical protein JZ751_002119 [Albula glossodonta]